MEPKDIKNDSSFSKEVADKERRKIEALGNERIVWSGLSMFGLVGWSIVVPTIIGASLGMWLDAHYPQTFSWALSLLLAGLFGGCIMAWQWITKEDKEINDKKENND